MALRAVCVGLVAFVAGAVAWPYPDMPEILGIEIDRESLKHHHTHHYRMNEGYVVRRGFDFEAIVTTDKQVGAHEAIVLSDDSGIGKFHTERVRRHGDDNGEEFFDENRQRRYRHRIRISTAHDAPINKYEDLIFYVAATQAGLPDRKPESFQFQYPFAIYLIFNPWSEEDETYFPHEEVDEYLFNEKGLIWTGSENDHEDQTWYYGQFDQVVLDSFFRLIKDIDPTHRGSALKVGYHLSRHQGYVTSMGPKPFGNPNGILEGRWTAEFPDAYKLPSDWSSTVDILEAWNFKFDHKPVKFGQCWVFAALQLSFLRAIGIASRQIECFDGRIDKSATFYPDGKTHHVVNFYYDHNGTEVKREGHVWNFHSWNDIWLRRDTARHSGWQALDGTPKGLGAASVHAVYDLEEGQVNDTSTLISSVHATVQKFLVECKDAEHKDCDIKKRLQYNKDGVNLIVTKPPGKWEEQDITSLYVRRGVDVFDGAPHDPWHNATNNVVADADTGLVVDVTPSATRVIVGKPVEVTVRVDASRVTGTARVGVTADLKTYDGEVVKTLTTKSVSVAPGTTEDISVIVTPETYKQAFLDEMFVDVRAVGVVEDQDIATLSHASVMIRSPPLNVVAPPVMAAYDEDTNAVEDVTFNTQVVFENPHDFALEKVCVTVSPHNLKLVDAERVKCFAMDAREAVTVIAEFEKPTVSGSYSATFSLSGQYLPTQRKYMELTVVDGLHGLRHY